MHKFVLSEVNEQTLMNQVNLDIEVAADAAVEVLAGNKKLIYPPSPDNVLDAKDLEIMRHIASIPNFESVIKKIVADGAANVVFKLLNYIDGTGDPNDASGKWSGVALIDHPNEGDPYVKMLHDEFYDAYWNAKKLR